MYFAALITDYEIDCFNAGDVVLLTGSLLTGRDAAHKRIFDIVKSNNKLPINLRGKFSISFNKSFVALLNLYVFLEQVIL